MIANQAGATVWRWDNTEPFGEALPNDDPDGDGIAFVFDLRFPGQYFDRETGLSYNVFRDYDPGIGRYIQSDPIGLLGGLNTYLYVTADPLTRIDPKGLLDCFNVADCYGQANANYSDCTRLYNSNIACTVAFARCLIVARSPTLLRVCLVSAAASCAAAQFICINQLLGDQKFCDQHMSIDGYRFGENYGEGPDCKCYSRPRG
jgi:RHS repeat-associated protein